MKRSVDPIPLAPQLLERLERELTDELIDRLVGYAEVRVLVKRRCGVPGYERKRDEAEVMVQDAIALTIIGHRTWNPEVDLYDHLCGVLRSESTKEAAQALHRKVEALAHAPNDGEREDVTDERKETSQHDQPVRAMRPRSMMALTEAKRRLIEPLRIMARREPLVGMLLDAYESGCSTKREVRAVTGMTHDEYRSARRKLDTMLTHLPDNLSEGAHDAMEITYDY